MTRDARYLTDYEIEAATVLTTFPRADTGGRATGTIGSYDAVRAAYEWLDAQEKLTASDTPKVSGSLIDLISGWCQLDVGVFALAVAAHLHPDIRGIHPHYNIAPELTLPAPERLAFILTANPYDLAMQHHAGIGQPLSPSSYAKIEKVTFTVEPR